MDGWSAAAATDRISATHTHARISVCNFTGIHALPVSSKIQNPTALNALRVAANAASL